LSINGSSEILKLPFLLKNLHLFKTEIMPKILHGVKPQIPKADI